MSNRNTSNVYTGPSVGVMISNHTLAKEIIARHNDPCPILDDDELALLQQFVASPAEAGSILQARGLAHDPMKNGSLVAYVMSLHGTDRAALNEEEIQSLSEWFESGGANV
jgi:hypothetical protein